MDDKMKESDRILYERALRVYGINAQLGMVVEEAGELLVAVNRWTRNRCGVDEIIGEIADVSIMLEQLSIIVGDVDGNLVRAKRKEKLTRLTDRVARLELNRLAGHSNE